MRSGSILTAERAFHRGGLSTTADLSGDGYASGLGPFLLDAEGTRFLDLFASAGVVSLGHGDPGFAEEIRRLAGGLFSSPTPHENRIAFWETLRPHLPQSLERLFFFSSGTEATEAAMRLAQAASGRRSGICFDGGYHGRTMGAAAVSGIIRGDHTTAPYLAPPEKVVSAIAPQLQSAAFVIVEPIQGTAGNRQPQPGMLRSLRSATDYASVPLIVDEIITGGGRTGSWFQSLTEGVEPDLLVLGKGIGNGLPIACLAARSDLVDRALANDRAISFSSSFGGNPFVVGAAAYVLREIASRRLVEASRAVGEQLLATLRTATAGDPLVTDVEGVGLMIGIELASCAKALARVIQSHLREHGVLIGATSTRLRINPPLCFSADHIEPCSTAFRAALDAIRKDM